MWVELLAYDLILRRWLANPRASRREIGVLSAWESSDPNNDKPPSTETMTRIKSFYKKHAPSGYLKLFTNEGERGQIASSPL